MEIDRKPFTVELAEPLRTATGTIDRRTGEAIRVRDGGRVGIGEATPLPGWTESLSACRRALADCTRPRAALAADRFDDVPAARHGLSLALADLDAAATNRPLYRWLGADDAITHLPIHRSIGHGSTDETVELAAAAVDGGAGAIKLKVGVESVDRDVDRVAAVRRAVGDDVTLRLDANGAWDLDRARRAVDSLAPYRIDFLEQPVPPGEPAAFGRLGGRIDIAIDESLIGADPTAVRPLLDGVDVVICKPMVLGGLDRGRELARIAAEDDVRTIVTTTVDGVIARTGAIHLAASIDPGTAHGVATAPLLASDLGPDPAPIADGRVVVPQTDGLGTAGPWGDR